MNRYLAGCLALGFVAAGCSSPTRSEPGAQVPSVPAHVQRKLDEPMQWGQFPASAAREEYPLLAQAGEQLATLLPLMQAGRTLGTSSAATKPAAVQSVDPQLAELGGRSPKELYNDLTGGNDWRTFGPNLGNYGSHQQMTIRLRPSHGDYYEIEQTMTHDLDLGMDRVEYRYWVQKDDTGWTYVDFDQTGEKRPYRYAEWREFYAEGSTGTRELLATSLDPESTTYRVPPLSFFLSGNRGWLSSNSQLNAAPEPESGPTIWNSVSFLEVEYASSGPGEPRGLEAKEYYSEVEEGNGISGRGVLYGRERRGGLQRRIITGFEDKWSNNSGNGLKEQTEHHAISVWYLMAGANSTVELTDVRRDYVGTPKYRSINALWYSGNTNPENLDTDYPYANSDKGYWLELNPSIGGYAGKYLVRENGMTSEFTATLVNGALKTERVKDGVDWSMAGRVTTARPPTLTGVTTRFGVGDIAVDGLADGTLSFSGNLAQSALVGTLNGYAVEIGTHGMFIYLDGQKRYLSFQMTE